MRRSKSKVGLVSLWMFLLGLGSQTQIHFVGSIGISELFVFLVAPFVLTRDWSRLKCDKFSAFVWIGGLTCVGCIVSGLVNHTHWVLFLKGLALPYGVWASVIVFHSVMRRDMRSVRWFFLGSFFSGIISIFIFQPETYTVRGGTVVQGDEAVAAVMDFALFWSEKIGSLLYLPIRGWYFSTPNIYCWAVPIFMTLYTIMHSQASGRASALVTIMSVGLLIWGGKSRSKIASIGRYFMLVLLLTVGMLFAVKSIYQYSAKNGLLGDAAKEKYEKQSMGSNSGLRLLMSGRAEFFSSLRACLDRPIIGFGPNPQDEKGYYREFLEKYGDMEDYRNYVLSELQMARMGCYYNPLRAHSHITQFWINNGIMGLIFWLYVFWLFYKYFSQFACAYPQLYGYLVLSIIGSIWGIFFSPMSSRIGEGFLIACLLMVRAIYYNRVPLSFEEIRDIRKHDRK